jgi:CRP/FNR family transcriptional regulator
MADFDLIGVNTTLPPGATLFKEGAPCSAVLLLISGRVKLSCTSREGRILLLKIASPGDVLGLSAVISHSRYEVTAEASGPVTFNSILEQPFLAFLKKHGEASLHVARMLSAEYRDVFSDARRLALSGSSAGRLAGVLLEWGTTESIGKKEMRLTMALSHGDLANLVGCSRETVTRLLGVFKRDKLIVIHGVCIFIPFPEKLERMAA